MFSKFSIWDKEVREFIDDISHLSQTTKADIEAWFYQEGMLLFQKTQYASCAQDVKAFQNTYGHRPVMTSAGMLGYVFVAFSKLRDEFFKAFFFTAQIEPDIKRKFNFFITQAINAHLDFYAVRADVTNQLHEYLDANPNTLLELTPNLAIDLFENYKIRLPIYGADIDANVLTIKEFITYMKTQKAAGATSSAASQPQTSGDQLNSAKLNAASKESSGSASSEVLSSSNVVSASHYSFLTTLSAENIQQCNNLSKLIDALKIKLNTLTLLMHGQLIEAVQQTISALDEIKRTNTVTATQKELLDIYKNEFRGLNGSNSRTQLIFDQVLKLAASQAAQPVQQL